MRAVRIDSPNGDIRVVDIEEPVREVGDVLIESVATTLCGTDIEIWHGERPAEFVRFPVIPGHEWAGRVLSSSDPTLRPGDPVVCEGMQYCGSCANCRTGKTNLCLSGYEELGFTRPGGLAALVAVARRAVHRLPGNLPLTSAPLLEPAAVIAHAFLTVRPTPGAAVVVIGDGALGQIAVQMAFAYGARAVVLVGTKATRLAIAESFGATAVGVDDRAAVVNEVTNGLGADVVIETAGATSAVAAAFSSARRGGAVALTGLSGAGRTLSVPSDVFVLQQLRVHGICGATPESWEHAIALAESGALNLTALLGTRFPVARANEAFRHAADPTTEDIRVLITDQAFTGASS